MTDFVTLTIETALVTGAGLANGKAVIGMTVPDIDVGNALVVPSDIEVDLDANGRATTPCFANTAGTQGSQLVIRLYDAAGNRQFKGLGTVPKADCHLRDILDLQPPPALSDAQVAELAAQGYATDAQNWATKTDAEVVVGQGYGAKKYATDAASSASAAQAVLTDPGFVAVKNDLPNIDIVAGDKANVDTVATNIAEVNTAATNIVSIQAATAAAASASASASSALAIYGDTATMNAAVASSATNAGTATAQAGLAQTYAASASSVVQQDLSAIIAALHRSPNANTAMFIYDTSRDSDGGAWVDRVTNTSWFNEALNGPWIYSSLPNFMGIGAASTGAEIVARAMGGTLGSNLLVGAFANLGGTVTTNADGTLTVACTVNTGASQAFASEVNASYLVTGRVTSANLGRIYINDTNNGANPESAYPNLLGGFAFVTTAIAAQTYIVLGSTTAGQTITYADLKIQKVQAWAPSGAYYQDATTGKHQRLWKNVLPNTAWAGGTSGTEGSGAVAPPGWSFPTGSGSVVYGLSTYNAAANSIRFQATAQLPYANATYPAVAGVTYVQSCRVEAITSGTPAIQDLLGAAGISYSATYKANGATVTGTYLAQVGDVLEVDYVPTAAGTANFRFGPGCFGNATMDVTLSSPQVELVSSGGATAFENKTGTDAGTTEVFRGNTAKFPRLSASIAEAASVTIYDLTQPGRPMWMRFTGGVDLASLNSLYASTGVPVKSISCGQGMVLIGSAATGDGGISHINFVADKTFMRANNTNLYNVHYGISGRNTAGTTEPGLGAALANRQVNAIAMCVMPDAPLDPFTGLQVPTIAVVTAGGVSEIKHDGSVVSSGNTVVFTKIALTPTMLVATNATGFSYFATNPGSLGASWSFTTTITGATAGSPSTGQSLGPVTILGGTKAAFAGSSTPRVSLMVANTSAFAGSLTAQIADTYNTGWMVGDIRRCWLSSNVAESITATEQVVGGDFTTDTGAWTETAGITISGGTWNATAAAASNPNSLQTLPISGAHSLQLKFTVTSYTSGGVFLRLYNAAGIEYDTPTATAVGTYTYFIQTSSAWTGALGIRLSATSTLSVDNVSVQEVIADRSYKNQPLTINGTLAKVLTGGLAMYSGWSATNYAQQAYSADLDPGTGGFYVPITSTIPVGVAAAGWAFDRSAAAGASYKAGHDATGHLTASVFDGTTTRTVTTTAAYNTGTVFSWAVGLSPSGTLTIYVGGKAVATTTGAPLLTLTNASATCTVGVGRGLTAPWSGSLALVKPGMTIPTLEQASFTYEQEKFLWMAGAVATLPDSGAVVDMDYDPMQDRLKVVSAANESSWTGLVSTGTAAVAAGSFTKASHRSGIKLLARSTTNPGVDVSIPAYGLREELFNRAARAAKLARQDEPFDYTGGFTATLTAGSTALTSVAGWTFPQQANPRGVVLSATGIPANAYITDVVGTTVYISAPVTTPGTGVQVAMTGFPLPPGYELKEFKSAGIEKQEGAANYFTRAFDGFREMENTPVSPPGYATWVRLKARRTA